MPDIDMYVKSSATINGRQYGQSHVNGYDCRELATVYMVGDWQQSIRDIARHYLHESDYYNYGVMSVVLERAIKPAKLRLTVLFDEEHWNTVPDALRADVRAFIRKYYKTPLHYRKRVHVIDNSTWWEKSVQRLNGYTIVGDARAVPAFFWSVYFLRSWMEAPQLKYPDFDSFAQWCFDNEDADEFYDPADDEDEEGSYYGHLEAYNMLVSGREPAASVMLALSCGPIDAYNTAVRNEDRVAYINSHPYLLEAVNSILEEAK